MGIRFCCPNGHRLNVKEFLAGKRGICPECGVKLRIPLQSDPRIEEERETRRRRKTLPSKPVTPPNETTNVPQIQGNVFGRISTVDPDVVSPPDLSSGRVTKPELWFVRPATGGQFGPASEDVFQSWVDEGRVTADSYVWREGWEDWKLATEAVPALSVAKPTVVPTAQDGPAEVAIVADDKVSVNDLPLRVDENLESAGAAELYRRQKSTKMALTMVVVLTFACIVLAVALIYVVRFR